METPSMSSVPSSGRSSSSTAATARRAGQRRRRAEEREDAEKGFLRRATVSQVTRLRYKAAAEVVESHLGAPLATFKHCYLDKLMAEYMEHVFLQGETPAIARYAMFGTAFELDLVTRDPQVFPLAKKTLKGFMKKAPEPSRDPPPYEVAWLAASYFAKSVGGRQGLLAAAATLVAADGYLRPSEALGLRKEDFYRSGEGRATQWSVVVAPLSRAVPAKNKQFDDGYVVGAHDRQYVRDLVEALVTTSSCNEKVFSPLELPLWEKMFRDFSKAEGLKVTPHGLRHTGPSHDFHVHKEPLHGLQLRGRWLAIESCRRYTKPARLLRATSALTNSQLEKADVSARTLVAYLLDGLGGRPADGVSEYRKRPLKRRLIEEVVLPVPRRSLRRSAKV
jgi:integrase